MVFRAAFNAVLLLCMAGMIGHAAMPKKWLSFHPGLALLQGVSWGLTLVGIGVWVTGAALGTKAVVWAVAVLVVASLVHVADWARLVVRALVSAKRTCCRYPVTMIALGIPVLWSLPALLLPIIDSDGLRYHLALPKLFLIEGRVFLYPWDIVGAYPQAAEMFYLLGLQMGSGVAAKWLHFFVVCLGTAALMMMVGGRRSSGPLAGLAYIATPAVLAGASAAFIDGFAILHVAVAVVGLKRRVHPGAIGLALAGAVCTKWTVAPAIAGCLFVIVVESVKGQRWRNLLVVATPVVLLIAPLAIRNAAVTGDPFFPIATGLISHDVPGVDSALMHTVTQRHREIPGPFGVPWGRSIGDVEPDEIVGWHHLVGLLLLPVFIRDRRARLAAALIVPYLIVGLFFHPSIRLAVPMIWGFAVVEGIGLSRLKPAVGLIVVLVSVVPLLDNVGVDARSVIVGYVTGDLTSEDVVERLVPGAHAAAFVNRQPESGRVMALDFPAPFLFDRGWIAEGLVNRPPLALWLEQGVSSGELFSRLQALDVRWIVVTPGYGGGRPESLLPVARSPEHARNLLNFRRQLERIDRHQNVDIWRVR